MGDLRVINRIGIHFPLSHIRSRDFDRYRTNTDIEYWNGAPLFTVTIVNTSELIKNVKYKHNNMI